MALTTLDPKTALVVIDLQQGIVAYQDRASHAGVIKHAANLISAFRRHQLPIVLVNVNGGAPGRTDQNRKLDNLPADWADLVPELGQQPGDHRVTKQTWGAFTGTDLESHLKTLGVTQIVLAGVATSMGVESTARFAHELGFNVTLAIDAMTDMSADAHENSVERVFPKLGETATTGDIVEKLDARR